MAKYTEQDLQNALTDINNGMPVAHAARHWGVPRTTLSGRKNHRYEARRVGMAHLQKLSLTQEAMLANWIRVSGSLGFPPSHATIHYFAFRMLGYAAGSDSLNSLGIHWIRGFFHRNPSVKTLLSERLEVDRANAANPDTITKWFELFNNPIIKTIPLEHCYNMDEAGIMEGLGANGLIVRAFKLHKAHIKKPNQGS